MSSAPSPRSTERRAACLRLLTVAEEAHSCWLGAAASSSAAQATAARVLAQAAHGSAEWERRAEEQRALRAEAKRQGDLLASRLEQSGSGVRLQDAAATLETAPPSGRASSLSMAALAEAGRARDAAERELEVCKREQAWNSSLGRLAGAVCAQVAEESQRRNALLWATAHDESGQALASMVAVMARSLLAAVKRGDVPADSAGGDEQDVVDTLHSICRRAPFGTRLAVFRALKPVMAAAAKAVMPSGGAQPPAAARGHRGSPSVAAPPEQLPEGTIQAHARLIHALESLGASLNATALQAGADVAEPPHLVKHAAAAAAESAPSEASSIGHHSPGFLASRFTAAGARVTPSAPAAAATSEASSSASHVLVDMGSAESPPAEFGSPLVQLLSRGSTSEGSGPAAPLGACSSAATDDTAGLHGDSDVGCAVS